MPKQEEQGTGKHPHKSSEEPFEHHEAKSESGEKSKAAGAGAGSHGSASHESKSSEESKEDSESSDLKSREYTDAQGNVHHHTRTFQDQHDKK